MSSLNFKIELELPAEELDRLERFKKYTKVLTNSEAIIKLLDRAEHTVSCSSCKNRFQSFSAFPEICPLCGKMPLSFGESEEDKEARFQAAGT